MWYRKRRRNKLLFGAAARNGSPRTSSFGRGQAEQRSTVSRLLCALGSLSLRVASATGPPTSGRRSGRTSSEVRVRNRPWQSWCPDTESRVRPQHGRRSPLVCRWHARNAMLGRGSAATCPSGQAVRFANIGGPWRPVDFGLQVFVPGTKPDCPRAVLFGGRQTFELVSGSSSNRTRGNNPLIGSSSELSGLWPKVGRSRTCLLSSCVSRGRTLRGATTRDVAPSRPLGRTCPRPTDPSGCDGPLQTSSFGWQTRRPRTFGPGVTDLCRRHLRMADAVAPNIRNECNGPL